MGIINWESKLGLKSKTNIVVQKTQPIAQIKQLSKTRNFELRYATIMSPTNVEKLYFLEMLESFRITGCYQPNHGFWVLIWKHRKLFLHVSYWDKFYYRWGNMSYEYWNRNWYMCRYWILYSSISVYLLTCSHTHYIQFSIRRLFIKPSNSFIKWIIAYP